MNLSKKIYLIVILTLFAFTTCKAQEVQKSETDFSQLKGAYLGQNPPGKKPELFAPGIVTTDASEGCSGWGKLGGERRMLSMAQDIFNTLSFSTEIFLWFYLTFFFLHHP